nr:hypothetical protein [Nocardia otitidiscaviarum]
MTAPVPATVRTPGRVEVEFRSRASLRLRFAHTLLRATLRPAVDALSVLAERTPLRGDPAFRIANAADLAAYPLRRRAGPGARRCASRASAPNGSGTETIPDPTNPQRE